MNCFKFWSLGRAGYARATIEVEKRWKRQCRYVQSSREMVKAIVVRELGGPEVLKWNDVDVGQPGKGQVRIRHTAIGINFIDVYFRKGIYSTQLPYIPGMEGAGVVTAVGEGSEWKVGDRVGYARSIGAYSEERIISEDTLVSIPPSIDSVTAAAMLLKGSTAQFLLRSCFKVESGHTILVHAAAGGVGSLLCQWGNALGAKVIGTVSTQEKATQALQDGAHHVIIYGQEDVVARVNEITDGLGVHVVYDSVGMNTFQSSLDCLATRGMLVSFGQSSGIPDPVPLSALLKKSLILTRPSLMHFMATKAEQRAMVDDVFSQVAAGVLKIRVNQTYRLSEACKAHEDLEARKTTGSTVLLVDDI